MRSQIRTPEVYGQWELSIQASSAHYCSPKKDGLWLDEYASVEVAIFQCVGKGKKSVEFLLPSAVSPSLSDLDERWESGVGGWISWEDVERIRAAMKDSR